MFIKFVFKLFRWLFFLIPFYNNVYNTFNQICVDLNVYHVQNYVITVKKIIKYQMMESIVNYMKYKIAKMKSM